MGSGVAAAGGGGTSDTAGGGAVAGGESAVGGGGSDGGRGIIGPIGRRGGGGGFFARGALSGGTSLVGRRPMRVGNAAGHLPPGGSRPASAAARGRDGGGRGVAPPAPSLAPHPFPQSARPTRRDRQQHAMTSGSVPQTDPALAIWAANLAARVAGRVDHYGASAAQSDAFAALNDSFQSAYAASSNADTRTRGKILAKNDARDLLVIAARQLVAVIQAYPATTDEQRVELGLRVRKDGRTPVPAPTVSPAISTAAGPGRTVVVTIQDPADERRARPRGAASTTVLSHIGPTPPASIAAWAYQASVSRRTVTLPFDAALPPGTCVWVTAFYQNARGEAGPASTPTCEYLGGAGVSSAAGGAVVTREEGQTYPKAA